MKINLINPNTCLSMTRKIEKSAKSAALATTEIIIFPSQDGPESIESAFDEAIASAALLDIVLAGEREGVDAHIIACFGDPGLDAAREVSSVPVIGIANAAFQLASQISYKFGIVTTMTRTLPASKHLLANYGYEHSCSGVRATDIPVLNLENLSDETYLLLKQTCESSINIDGAEAIVLGCAGMSDLAERLSLELETPVVDGVSAAVKLAESLHQLGLKTCKTGQYNLPFVKKFHGRYKHLGNIPDCIYK